MPIAAATLSSINGTTAASTSSINDPGSQDRFLKLLVTQLQNQDPLSPTDNAQLTSQLAQISTVTGISTLNDSVKGLSGQFLQSQTLQGASLIGKSVVVPGNRVDIDTGVGQGGFQLASPADAVKVELLSPAGQVIDTVNLGAQSAGVHSFDWASGNYTNGANIAFRVTATNGSTPLDVTTLTRDKVSAVSISGDSLMLNLQRNGTVKYSDVKSIN